ncbi:MAG: hypothetical protein KDC05_15745 [Bacteroidales bacterium]|nr:hypothetical protein [Bacteroidales bacterium]
MKKIIITGLLFICIVSSHFGQTVKQIHIDAGLLRNYDGFLKLYSGVIELGGDYSISLTKLLQAGVAFHAGYLNRNEGSMKAYLYKPAVQLAYTAHFSKRFALMPAANLGYAFINLRNDAYDYRETQSGLNTGIDLRFIWKTEDRTDFFIFGRYSYIYLDEDKHFTELEYYRNLHQSAFGIGIKIK